VAEEKYVKISDEDVPSVLNKVNLE